ncbi:hypothetical protein GCM10011574_70710 [Microbispora bryophytorum]|uniref:Uncharacterized protein n=1 Tax=Microbispora bryophytorum TaxID=1460882 RepID=A0A8H9H6P2_9ACTN|nr:hypothetical protein GCM10011574_70710 [Microbispora bryophytorum]
MTTLLLALVTAVPEQEAFRPASDPAVTVKNTLPVVFATVPPAVQDEPEVREETRAAAVSDGATVGGRAAEASAGTSADTPAGASAGTSAGAERAEPPVEPAAAKCRSPAPGASSGFAVSIRATVQNFLTVRCSVAVSAASCTAGRGPAAADRVTVPVTVAAAP